MLALSTLVSIHRKGRERAGVYRAALIGHSCEPYPAVPSTSSAEQYNSAFSPCPTCPGESSSMPNHFFVFTAKSARGSNKPGREVKSSRKCRGTPLARPPPRGRLDPLSAWWQSPSSRRISVSLIASAAAALPNPGHVSGIHLPPLQVPTRLRSMVSCCLPLSASRGLPRICDRT